MGEVSDYCRCGHRRGHHDEQGCFYEYDHGAGIECDCVRFRPEGQIETTPPPGYHEANARAFVALAARQHDIGLHASHVWMAQEQHGYGIS